MKLYELQDILMTEYGTYRKSGGTRYIHACTDGEAYILSDGQRKETWPCDITEDQAHEKLRAWYADLMEVQKEQMKRVLAIRKINEEICPPNQRPLSVDRDEEDINYVLICDDSHCESWWIDLPHEEIKERLRMWYNRISP